MNKTYIAPVILVKTSFIDDLMVSLPSGGSASGSNVTDADVKEEGWHPYLKKDDEENQYSLW